MELLIIGLLLVGVLFLFFMFWFFSTWNRLVALEENAIQSWSNIDVLLRQRYDMLPNLENIVKGYASHEKDLFMEFAKARQMAAGALQNKDVKGVSAAESMMANMMPRITAVAEAYPELKSDTSFLNIQNELARIETAISAGDVAPKSRPMGPLIRAAASVLKPSSANRSKRDEWVRLLPRDPI